MCDENGKGGSLKIVVTLFRFKSVKYNLKTVLVYVVYNFKYL